MERQAISPIVHLAKIMDNVSDQNFQFNNEYKGRQDEIGILYADYEKMLNQIDMLIKRKIRKSDKHIEIQTSKSYIAD